MGGNHPKNIDPWPKRRKDKDNPYEIFTTGLGTTQPHYFLSFMDGAGVEQCIEIDKALFDAFDRFELDDISFMHKVDKHYERLEQTEESLYKRHSILLCQWKNSLPGKLRKMICIVQSLNFLKSNAAVWCCTTLESLLMNK